MRVTRSLPALEVERLVDRSWRSTRCLVCHERVDVNRGGWILYEQARIGACALPTEAHVHAGVCDVALQRAPHAFVKHAHGSLLELLDLWEDLYDEQGSDSPLPPGLVEALAPAQFDDMADVLELAHEAYAKQWIEENPDHGYDDPRFGEPWEQFRDNGQGYHDEWPPIVSRARVILL